MGVFDGNWAILVGKIGIGIVIIGVILLMVGMSDVSSNKGLNTFEWIGSGVIGTGVLMCGVGAFGIYQDVKHNRFML